MERFERWWYNEGSTSPEPDEELERFVYRQTRLAWSNGCYCGHQHTEPTDEELIAAFRAGVDEVNDRCSELPYFLTPDSCEYEFMVAGLRRVHELVLHSMGATCYDQGSQQEESCPESAQLWQSLECLPLPPLPKGYRTVATPAPEPSTPPLGSE